jgi:hypothetical protein
MEHRIKYMISADFGQTTDYTAVAVTRRRLEPSGTGAKYAHEGLRWEGDPYHGARVPFRETRQDVEQHYDLIRLDRVQLHTPYTKIAKGIVKLLGELYHLHMREDGLRPAQPVDVGLAIDEGGVGKAVKDILVDAIENGIADGEPHIIFLPVTVHGGANTTKSGGFYHVPKRDLVHAGIVAYQNGMLRVGKLRHRSVLEEELKNYRLKQNLATGYAAFEPLREGQHDDLLFATCLGVWAWERAIEKTEYLSFPGEWALEGVPVNVVGEGLR